MSDEATVSGGKTMSQLLNDFVWDDDMIDYVRGIRPTRGGIDWIDAERILTVMNMSGNHFVTGICCYRRSAVATFESYVGIGDYV